jgi:dUTP pyrophosphatase
MSVTIPLIWRAGADTALGLPFYASLGAAGADLRANFPDRAGIALAPMARALIPTGLIIALPHGYEAQLRPRSGLALHQGLTLLNSPGTIDSDYRGEIGVIMINLGAQAVQIDHGMRIAQMVIAPVVQAQFALRAGLDDTPRGQGGFGSSGT